MAIHQIQLRYEPLADRLLLSVRTHAAEVYRVWLTRRMVARLAGPYRLAVSQLVLPRRPGDPPPMPQAQQMLAQVARERPLKDTEFGKPFADDQDATYPLGPEPLLASEIDVRRPPAGGLQIALREARGRRLDLTLSEDLATALLRLLDQSLPLTDWALPVPESNDEPAPAPGLLN